MRCIVNAPSREPFTTMAIRASPTGGQLSVPSAEATRCRHRPGARRPGAHPPCASGAAGVAVAEPRTAHLTQRGNAARAPGHREPRPGCHRCLAPGLRRVRRAQTGRPSALAARRTGRPAAPQADFWPRGGGTPGCLGQRRQR